MNPQKDDTVYSIQGQEATYISAFNGGHLVAPHYEDNNGEIVLDAPEQWKEVFSKPPTAVLEKEVAKLTDQIAEMASRVTELRTQEREARQIFDATNKRLKAYEPLKNVVDFLDGKMTHVVETDTYERLSVRILTVEQTAATDESSNDDYRNGKWTKPLKLMVLHGHSRKPQNAEWRLFGYSDGSGSSKLVYPFCSEEDAKEKAKELLLPTIEAWDDELIEAYKLKCAVESALAIGIPVPDGAIQKVKQEKIDQMKKDVEKAEKELAQRQQKLLLEESK